MADQDPAPAPTVLLPQSEIEAIVADLARRIAPVIDDETVAAVLLTGGLWFAADLTRALSRAGRNVRFDALWLASYGDETTSRGKIDVYATRAYVAIARAQADIALSRLRAGKIKGRKFRVNRL